MRLRDAQAAIDAGYTIVRKDETVVRTAAFTLHGAYHSFEGLQIVQHDTFDALYAYLEPDADGFTDKELDRWEVETALTEEEQQIWVPMAQAFLLKDIEEQNAAIQTHYQNMLAKGMLPNELLPLVKGRSIAQREAFNALLGDTKIDF